MRDDLGDCNDLEFGAGYLNLAANAQVFVFGDREDELLDIAMAPLFFGKRAKSENEVSRIVQF